MQIYVFMFAKSKRNSAQELISYEKSQFAEIGQGGPTIVEHIKIKEHPTKVAEELIVDHLFYIISVATNKRTPDIFLTAKIVKHVWLLGAPEYTVYIYNIYIYIYIYIERESIRCIYIIYIERERGRESIRYIYNIYIERVYGVYIYI